MPEPNSERKFISAWWMDTRESSESPLKLSMKSEISSKRSRGTENTTDVIQRGCWSIRSTGTVKQLPGARNVVSRSQVRRSAAPKDKEITKQAKKQEYQDICDRNIVEGEFGVGKRAYGLNRIMAHLPETSVCVIGVALLCMNLAKRLRSLCFDLFCLWITKLPSRLSVQVAA